MTLRVSTWSALLGLAVCGAVAQSACSNGEVPIHGATTSSGSSDGGANDASSSAGFAQGSGGSNVALDVEPAALQTITVPLGQHTPTVAYTATLNGSPVNAGWGVDHGNIGTIPTAPASTAVFTPTGTTGGLVTVLAGASGATAKRQILVQLTGTQNGVDPNNPLTVAQIATSVGQLTQGGGIGGVGGEGLGVAVTDQPTLAALGTPTGDGSAQGLKFLYPYDKTVWPRGLRAPLLQWDWSTGDADAIQIQLKTTSGSFSWTGTFGRPAILAQTGTKFVRHPIPEDVWEAATDTAGGNTDQLTLSFTVAKNAMAYGPISETWTIAPARLAGTVYYNSYGTQLVKNSIEHSYNNGPQFGAAVLSIKSGDTGPTVVAGTPSPVGSGTGCRVCHVVAADGSGLVVQHGDDYARTSTYDLKNANAEAVLTGFDNTFGWAGLTPDGKMALTNAADLAAGAPLSQLYAFPPSGAPLAATGIGADLKAGTPAFSPDGKHVAFDFIGGTIGANTGDGTQLVGMDFDGPTTAFSNFKVLATMPAGKRAGFPSWFPTNDAVAYHYQIVPSGHRYNTWQGAEAQVWWTDLATGTPASLDALNGKDSGGMTSYLPTGPNNHADDTVLNYEPTVNPIASGGYVWVVFTSRRLYGNVATNDPWLSDPRNYDATTVANVTTKKLWVAAIDLNAPAGTDPSHNAFYLPAQELVAGNARGFWVLDPCKMDGQNCQSGDQCCNGFCEPDANNQLVCSNMNPTCSQAQEKCTTAADCCDATNLCINGFCTVQTPN